MYLLAGATYNYSVIISSMSSDESSPVAGPFQEQESSDPEKQVTNPYIAE